MQFNVPGANCRSSIVSAIKRPPIMIVPAAKLRASRPSGGWYRGESHTGADSDGHTGGEVNLRSALGFRKGARFSPSEFQLERHSIEDTNAHQGK
jgi:hypothetical protein